jgi:hypothetical protein
MYGVFRRENQIQSPTSEEIRRMSTKTYTKHKIILKSRAFLDAAPCSIVYLNETTRPDMSHDRILQTRRRENLTSHKLFYLH